MIKEMIMSRHLLHSAAFSGDKNKVEELLNNAVDVNSINDEGDSALMYAAMDDHPEIIEVLLVNGADPDIVNEAEFCALDFAVANKSLPAVFMLLSHHTKIRHLHALA